MSNSVTIREACRQLSLTRVKVERLIKEGTLSISIKIINGKKIKMVSSESIEKCAQYIYADRIKQFKKCKQAIDDLLTDHDELCKQITRSHKIRDAFLKRGLYEKAAAIEDAIPELCSRLRLNLELQTDSLHLSRRTNRCK